jgi:hypothetical protein
VLAVCHSSYCVGRRRELSNAPQRRSRVNTPSEQLLGGWNLRLVTSQSRLAARGTVDKQDNDARIFRGRGLRQPFDGKRANSIRRIVSICTGSVVLRQMGLVRLLVL